MYKKLVGILVMMLLITTAISAVGKMNVKQYDSMNSSAVNSTIVWSDDFDSYATGSLLHGQGGWEAWDFIIEHSPYISDNQSKSTPNSVELDYKDSDTSSDIVRMFYGINSGLWNLTFWHYVSSDMGGHSALALFHTYVHNGSHGVGDVINVFCAHPRTGSIHNPLTGNSLPVVTDKWVEINIEIDFDQQIFTTYYNGTFLESTYWIGPKNLACINIYNSDYYSNASYYDDFSLAGDISDNSDLYCEGELNWFANKPGQTVTGSFILQNNGPPGSFLNWEIESTPEWGEWSIDPNSGTGLAGWDPIVVNVEVVTPEDNNKEFTGMLKIVNTDNPDDYEIINVNLENPRTKTAYSTLLLKMFERFPNAFPLLRQLLGL